MKGSLYKKLFNAFIYVLLLLAGWQCLKLAFENQNLQELQDQLHRINFFWVGMVFVVTALCHVLRALRWQLLLRASGHTVSWRYCFNVMMLGYLVSQVIPRLGELARAGALKRTHKVPATTGFGTIIFERLVDVACLAGIVALAAALEYEKLRPLLDRIIRPVKAWLGNLMADKPYVVYGLAGLILIWIIYTLITGKKQEKKQEKSKADELVERLWAGIWSFRHVQKKGLFIAYSIAIWVCYFLMVHLVLYAVDETTHFSWLMGFVLFTVSSIVRNVPVQFGAAGAYHLAMSESIIALYGVAATPALVVATLIHGIQLVFIFTLGAIGSVAVSLKK